MPRPIEQTSGRRGAEQAPSATKLVDEAMVRARVLFASDSYAKTGYLPAEAGLLNRQS